ncbi:extracellular solute-binding protein [Paenibacillus nanensis]|uniref:Extracellular solute-binding protein n=1 Tax=Paenibacillus nanensis TaxID=393251 RepID=A0A3A1VJE2_9BACL|nr:extracellular solute-binding protein [Paenibacillus nanensis]RIX60571.1 extracellular solute-binding protein [Paenibacillus nanensis]
MKKTKKLLSGVFTLALAGALALSGCSGSNNSGGSTNAGETNTGSSNSGSATESNGFKFGETPFTFTYYVNYDWWTTEPWGASPNSKWVQDNLHITVEPIQSGGAAAQKLSTMIASKELPDAIMMDRGPDVERLRQAGALVALDDYIEKYPNLKKWAGEETLNMLRSPDGKIYQFPNWYTSAPTGNDGWFVNKKIYEELGRPKLETFDDLYAYLKKVQETYPDVVPLEVGRGAQGVEVMFAGFANDHPSQFSYMKAYTKDDKLATIYENEAYKETLTFASKLFREGLITQDALTQKEDQVKEKLATGRVAVFVGGNATNLGREGHNALRAADPNAGYEFIWPLIKPGVDKNKVYPNGYNALGWNVNVITTNAENPEAIFAYLDWMTGEEGQRIMFFGPQGRYWDEVDADGAPIPNDKWFSTPQEEKDKDKLEAYVWAGNATYVDTTKSKIEANLPEEQRNWGAVAQLNVSWKTSYNNTQFNNIDPAPETDEGIILQQVNELATEYFGKMLFAQSDAEVASLIEEAKEQTNALGYEKVLEFRTKAWQENLAKMSGN